MNILVIGLVVYLNQRSVAEVQRFVYFYKVYPIQ